jgi:HNH endonuclease
VRDRGCAFPGCGAPPSHCDAHHIKHWADGGETSLKDLALLCRRHHRLVHEGGFAVEMSEAGPVFRRPDGTVIDRGPP